MVIILDETGVFFQKGLIFELKFISFSDFDLKERYLVEETTVLGFSSECIFEVEFLFYEFALDSGRRTS